MLLIQNRPDDAYGTRAVRTTALRPFSAGTDGHLLGTHPALDHGFVPVIDHSGDGTGLIRCLVRHWRLIPFEVREFKLHLKLQAFAALRWIRHLTATVSQYSVCFFVHDRNLAERSSNRGNRRGW